MPALVLQNKYVIWKKGQSIHIVMDTPLISLVQTIKTVKLMGDSLDTAREIVTDSPRRDDNFHKIESRNFSVFSRNTCTVSDKMDCSS